MILIFFYKLKSIVIKKLLSTMMLIKQIYPITYQHFKFDGITKTTDLTKMKIKYLYFKLGD